MSDGTIYAHGRYVKIIWPKRSYLHESVTGILVTSLFLSKLDYRNTSITLQRFYKLPKNDPKHSSKVNNEFREAQQH